jgi:hypothetical protein
MGLPEFRRGRALLGFMTEQEADAFIRGACVIENQNEFEAYKSKWLSANRAAKTLKPRPIWPVKHRDLPPEQQGYLKQLRAQDPFRHSFPGSDPRVQEVELRKLVAFQRNIDTEYANNLALRMKDDDRFLLETCLPLSFQQNIDITFDQAVPGVIFSSISPKLVFTGIQLTGVGGPEISVAGHSVNQPGALFLVGTQANYVQVVEFRSRCFLKNGYHRAYAALLSGRDLIPAVVMSTSDFSVTGAAGTGFFPKELLLSDAPPLLQDFHDEQLGVDVKVRSMRKVIRIRVDDFFLPR